MLKRTYSWPDGHWDWYQHLSFKHGVRAGQMIFVGGQVDKSEHGEPLHVYDIRAQTEVVINHIDRVLREFDACLADVTKLVAFYVDDGSVDEERLLAQIGGCLIEADGAPRGVGPAITLVPLPCLALPGMFVEIEAIAMRGVDGESLMRDVVNLPDLPALASPFCHGLRCGENLWISAQAAREPGGQIRHSDDIHAQTPIALDAVTRVLEALGGESRDAVKISCWYQREQLKSPMESQVPELLSKLEGCRAAVTELSTPCLPTGEAIRMDLWAMRSSNGAATPREYFEAEGLWRQPTSASYPMAVKSGAMVFVSGQLPLDTSGDVVDCGDLSAQTRTVMEYTRRILQSFGLTIDDMVKQNSFYLGTADPETIVTNQRLRSSYYAEPAGASTGVPLPEFPLDEVMVTVETLAMRR